MHIMEGYLPVEHAIGWTVVSAPFVGIGLHRLSRRSADNPSGGLFLGVCAGFAFAVSALKLPSVTGSSSHPTGIGLGSLLLGPFPMVVVGSIVLLFQALLVAHGGLTTWGANTFSMAIVGSFAAWGVHRLAVKIGVPSSAAIFLAATLSDLATYATTSLQLGLAFPAARGGVVASSLKFLAVFVPTQVPLAISEGLLTVFVMNLLKSRLGDGNRLGGLAGAAR
jgi:cobalt/nickel transport system permease protein